MYQLSQSLPCHSRDLRCLDYYAGILVTGGSDKIFKIFETKAGKLEMKSHLDIFQKNILSVRINRRMGEIFVLVGTGDGKIYGISSAGSPICVFQHNSSISSIDFIDQDHFVTGSWDGKAIVWEISTRNKISQYCNHKYAVAVFYNPLTDQVVSGSQDKAISTWNWKNGKEVKRIQGAHNDIIREISAVEQIGFITCSNDETLKLWSSDLEEIHKFTGHSAFVFTVKAQSLGKYYSGSDDKSIRVWDSQSLIQNISCPSSIWSIAIDENNDIYSGSSDGFLRVFTTDMTRRAPQNQIEAFNKQVIDSASKKSGMSAEDIKKLQTVDQMKKMQGKKEGEIRVFKNGSIPEAYMWQNGKWEKIGEVIMEGNQSGGGMSKPKYYPGDKYFDAGEYDYIFDVDDQSGVPKQIPFNDGANALEAAEKYCMREGLTKGYIEQIRKFLMQNSSPIPRQAIKNAQKQDLSQNNLRVTPQCISIEFTDIKNPQGLLKKVFQFNEKLQGTNCKLNERELEHCKRIVHLLQNSKNYHSWKLDFKQLDTIKKLLTWPKQLKMPVWDILRAFLCHYQSQTLFSGLDAGFDIISQLSASIEMENSQSIYALLFRTLSNTMIQNTNKNGVIKHAEIVFSSVQVFSQRSELKNKSLLSAVAAFMFNFSVSIFQKNLQKQDIISTYAKILQKRLEIDGQQQNRGLMLQAGANTVFKYQGRRGEFEYLRKYLNGEDVSKDLDLLLA